MLSTLLLVYISFGTGIGAAGFIDAVMKHVDPITRKIVFSTTEWLCQVLAFVVLAFFWFYLIPFYLFKVFWDFDYKF